jgi:ribosomal protein S20
MKNLKKFQDYNLEETKKPVSIKEQKEQKNYMFISNMKTIKRLVDSMLKMDEMELDSILDSHDWASDHISTAKDDVEEVYGFLKGLNTKSLSENPFNESVALDYLDELYDKGAISSDVYDMVRHEDDLSLFDKVGMDKEIRIKVLNHLDDMGGISSDVSEMERGMV